MEIRAVTLEDAEAIANIRRQDGVREGVLALSSDRLEVTAGFIRSLTEQDRAFVAVREGTAVGFAVLLSYKEEGRRHCATVAVMVDRDFQQRGVGHMLMKRLVDCADNELKLHRLELLVLTDNEKAIRLYKNYGFMIEATRKNAAVVGGKFVNEYVMGRLRGEGTKE
ncbi:MAG: GNAT family N-acetyltransferase [Synergistaceae bacterium]|nr:GNAT family N-acetyltransferase [Synergistaceae bacterium]